jgi:FKBP-type peptidyl-prolyl cis-trans isomerase FkpA
MDKRSPHRPQPARNVSSPVPLVLKVGLAASLLANAVLLGLVVASSRERPTPERPQPPSADARGAKPAEPTAVTHTAGLGAPTRGDPPLAGELRAYAALGTFVAENNHIPSLNWTQPQFAAFVQGLRSTYEGRGYPVDEEAIKLRDQISTKVQALLQTKQSNPIEDYFRTLREKEGVQKTESGLHYRITEQGAGEKPGPEATVVVSYAGRLPDGKSLPMLVRARVKTPVKDLLPGLAEGVQLLPPGGKALVYLPPALSFRSGPWPEGIPQGAPIIVFLELHEVKGEERE